jgi:hypothetical protein
LALPFGGFFVFGAVSSSSLVSSFLMIRDFPDSEVRGVRGDPSSDS